jgi:FkbM family methyltransferase
MRVIAFVILSSSIMCIVAFCCDDCRSDEAVLLQRTHTHLNAKLEGLSRFVGTPVPTRLVDLKSEQIDTNGMPMASLKVPGTDRELSIFVYDEAEDNVISSRIRVAHTWESANVQKLLNLWDSGVVGNFLDVGGNIGTFTLPIAHQIARVGAQVVTIEGMPSTAARLKAAIKANMLDNVALFAYAVGSPDYWGDSVNMARHSTNKGASAIDNTVGKRVGSQDRFRVGLTTIDSILDVDPTLQKVLAMKMDIEGSEGHALEGAAKFMAEYPPCYLMTEIQPTMLEHAGTPCPEVRRHLETAGYSTSPITCDTVQTVFLQQRDLQKCLSRFQSP